MNSQFTQIVLCLTVAVTLGSAEFIPSFVRFGLCSDVNLHHDFDLERFSGLWYVILHVPNELITMTRCITSNYTIVQRGEDSKLINDRNGLMDNGTEVSSSAELRVADDGEHSYFLSLDNLGQEIGVTIAETDYENYACVYSCLQRLIFKGEIVIVMSRRPTIKKKYAELCKNIITYQSSFSWSNLLMMEQGQTCPYWPDHTKAVNQTLTTKTFISDMVEKIDEGIQVLIEKSLEEEEMEDLIFFGANSSTWRNASAFVTIILGTLNVLVFHCRC